MDYDSLFIRYLHTNRHENSTLHYSTVQQCSMQCCAEQQHCKIAQDTRCLTNKHRYSFFQPSRLTAMLSYRATYCRLNKTGHRNQLFQLASKSGIVDVKLILMLKCCFIRSTFSTRFHICTYLYGRSVSYTLVYTYGCVCVWPGRTVYECLLGRVIRAYDASCIGQPWFDAALHLWKRAKGGGIRDERTTQWHIDIHFISSWIHTS